MVSGPGRVVSLLPAATEIVCALGAGALLVGRSHACDHPPEVAALPILTAPRAAGSRRDPEAAALSPFDVDGEMLRRLAPDLILGQDACRPCAASLADARLALAGAKAPRFVSLAPRTLAEVWDAIRLVARALGREGAGEALLNRLGERIGTLGERAGRRRGRSRPRIAALEWLDPLMVAGHWLPELIAIAGGEAVLAAPGVGARWLAWDELRAADPDALLVAPCGLTCAAAERGLGALTHLPGWERLRAVQSGRVLFADGTVTTRPGPRLVDALETLADAIARL